MPSLALANVSKAAATALISTIGSLAVWHHLRLISSGGSVNETVSGATGLVLPINLFCLGVYYACFIEASQGALPGQVDADLESQIEAFSAIYRVQGFKAALVRQAIMLPISRFIEWYLAGNDLRLSSTGSLMVCIAGLNVLGYVYEEQESSLGAELSRPIRTHQKFVGCWSVVTCVAAGVFALEGLSNIIRQSEYAKVMEVFMVTSMICALASCGAAFAAYWHEAIGQGIDVTGATR